MQTADYQEYRRNVPATKHEHLVSVFFFFFLTLFFFFRSLEQARLMDIVRPLVTSEDYVVQKHTKAHPFKAMGRVQVSVYRASFCNYRYLFMYIYCCW